MRYAAAHAIISSLRHYDIFAAYVYGADMSLTFSMLCFDYFLLMLPCRLLMIDMPLTRYHFAADISFRDMPVDFASRHCFAAICFRRCFAC